MIKCMVLALLAIPLGVVTADELSRTKRIKMERYSVTVPGSSGWETERDKHSQTVVIEKTNRRNKTAVWIYIVPHDMSKEYGTVHSEKWLGDDSRRREHANMIAMGVMTGMYRLENLEKFETDVGKKHGYAMRYQQVFPSHASDAYLFVYFPPDFGERGIAYKFLYSSIRNPSDTGEPDFTVFNFVIDSFKSVTES